MTFAVTMPVRRQALEPVTSAGRILLAEDDSELRSLIGYGLGLDGHEVVAMANGVELSDWLAMPSWVDVVISDVRMPGPSGLEVLTRFRRTNTSVPFVLITAFGSPALHAEATRLGATAVMDKPFEMDDLRELVRRLVARNGAGADDRNPEVIPFLSQDKGDRP